jgi:Fe-S-cluster-containing dehydrogenase component
VDAESEEMVGFDLEHCKGCGICASICPVNQKVVRKAEGDVNQDDPRLCIRIIEEGKFQEVVDE